MSLAAGTGPLGGAFGGAALAVTFSGSALGGGPLLRWKSLQPAFLILVPWRWFLWNRVVFFVAVLLVSVVFVVLAFFVLLVLEAAPEEEVLVVFVDLAVVFFVVAVFALAAMVHPFIAGGAGLSGSGAGQQNSARASKGA